MSEIKKLDKKLLRVGEVAEYFNVTTQTIHNWRSRGVINGLMIGGTRFYSVDEISRVIAQSEIKAEDEL